MQLLKTASADKKILLKILNKNGTGEKLATITCGFDFIESGIDCEQSCYFP